MSTIPNTPDEKAEIPTQDQAGKVYVVITLDEAQVNEYASSHGLKSDQVVHCTTLEQAEDAKTRQMPDRDVEIVDLRKAD